MVADSAGAMRLPIPLSHQTEDGEHGRESLASGRSRRVNVRPPDALSRNGKKACAQPVPPAPPIVRNGSAKEPRWLSPRHKLAALRGEVTKKRGRARRSVRGSASLQAEANGGIRSRPTLAPAAARDRGAARQLPAGRGTWLFTPRWSVPIAQWLAGALLSHNG